MEDLSVRKVLPAAKISQMSSPDGTGNGGNRCTEGTAAMIFDTLNLVTEGGLHGRDLMFQFTKDLNHGSTVSSTEGFQWAVDKLAAAGAKSVDYHWPTPKQLMAAIDAGHICAGGFNNYSKLRLDSGNIPYKWVPPPNGGGHVLLIVGYATDFFGRLTNVIVHDPLRSQIDGMPADYRWESLQDAGFADLIEVSKVLQIEQTSGSFKADPKPGWRASSSGLLVFGGILAAYRSWPAAGALSGFTALGLPETDELYHLVLNGAAQPAGTAVQRFERGTLVYDPHRLIDNPPGAAGDVYLAHWQLSGVPLQKADPIVKSSIIGAQANLINALNHL